MTLVVEAPVVDPVAVEPLEPTTPMKLSEAIRLGCLVVPTQAFGLYFRVRRPGGKIWAACALGTAAIAMGAENEDQAERKFGRFDDWKRVIVCHGRDARRRPLTGMVVHWNDDHNYSREEIARRLEEHGL